MFTSQHTAALSSVQDPIQKGLLVCFTLLVSLLLFLAGFTISLLALCLLSAAPARTLSLLAISECRIREDDTYFFFISTADTRKNVNVSACHGDIQCSNWQA